MKRNYDSLGNEFGNELQSISRPSLEFSLEPETDLERPWLESPELSLEFWS